MESSTKWMIGIAAVAAVLFGVQWFWQADALFKAIDTGDEAAAIAIIKAHPSKVAATRHGYYERKTGMRRQTQTIETRVSALHAAARAGMADLVATMVESKPDLNAVDDDGRTPLYLAAVLAIHGDYERVVDVLLQAGADPNKSPPKETILAGALRQKRPAIARKLLEAGAQATPAEREALEGH